MGIVSIIKEIRVQDAVKKTVIEAAITYLQTFTGVVLHPSMRTILEVWPDELKKLQDTFYNMNYDDDTPKLAAEPTPRASQFKFNPTFFTGTEKK